MVANLPTIVVMSPLGTTRYTVVKNNCPSWPNSTLPRFSEEVGRLDVMQAGGGKAGMRTLCLDFYISLQASPCILGMVENFKTELDSLTKDPTN